jgi:hypothetical protein
MRPMATAGLMEQLSWHYYKKMLACMDVQIVVAGTMEEISLYDLMPEVQAEVNRLVEESAGKISEEELSKRIFEKLKGKRQCSHVLHTSLITRF